MTSGHNSSYPTESHPQAPALTASAEPSILIDGDFIPALREVVDPEVGVNIVDLGLVYRAEWVAGGISVLMTMTSPSCPMAEMLVDDVRSALHRKFPDATATVEICRDPPWSPARMSEAGRRQLGWSSTDALDAFMTKHVFP